MSTKFKGLNVDMKKQIIAGSTIIAVGLMPTHLAFAAIENTVTVTGTGPADESVSATSTESVTVETKNAELTIAKTADVPSDVVAGSVITYTYEVTNSGNVTITNVQPADVQEGNGTLSDITLVSSPLTDNGTTGDSTDDDTDEIWDTLAPGDTVTWTSSYTILQADLNDNGGGDGKLINAASVTGTDPDSETVTGGTVVPEGGTIPETGTGVIDITLPTFSASLAITKVADITENAKAGDEITYTYTITNDGTATVTGIALSDTHNGTGTAPVPDADSATLTDNGTTGDSANDTSDDGEWDSLAPGDVLTVTATYTVTQEDVDTLQ